jgi:hypothetical protein
LRDLTNNAVVAAIVSAIASGVIAFLVAHYQAADAVQQTHQAQQVQALVGLRADASATYQDAVKVYAFQVTCSDTSVPWGNCAHRAPALPALTAAIANMDADQYSVQDRGVVRLASQFENSVLAVVDAHTAIEGEGNRMKIVEAWVLLNSRLGKLIGGE